ncbi:MAG: M20/M25/M40 family metallo-hydrolase [Deltaproteobacteria bacterium]|nr:M20/M25/M40 family metallo-hydrolase [Deltaproteobacteria bacterium]
MGKPVDWERVTQEGVTHLREYIRIDTTNPPGNEMEAALFLKGILEKESISCTVFNPHPGRANLMATLSGDGSKKPLILLNHMDVVAAERDKWEVDPFGGVMRDGYIYGRGALDNKGMGIAQLIAFLMLKRSHIALSRDIIFLALGDEEMGGRLGARWMLENVPQLKEAEYVLNEGGGVIVDEGGNLEYYEISTVQKVVFPIKVRASGLSGHGSIPQPDGATEKLVDALGRLAKWRPLFRVIPLVQEYFSNIAPVKWPHKVNRFRNLAKSLQDEFFAGEFTANPIHNAMVRDTIALTVIRAGTKANIIPSEGEAILDCRLIPGSSKEDFLEEVRGLIRETGAEVEVKSEAKPIPPSPLDTDLFRAITTVARRRDPNCIVAHPLLPGATDSRHFREQGVVCYDFSPFRLSQSDLLRIHGHNERLTTENLSFAIRLLYEILGEVSGF